MNCNTEIAINSFIKINESKFPGAEEINLFKKFVSRSIDYADNNNDKRTNLSFYTTISICEKLFETIENFDELKNLMRREVK